MMEEVRFVLRQGWKVGDEDEGSVYDACIPG